MQNRGRIRKGAEVFIEQVTILEAHLPHLPYLPHLPRQVESLELETRNSNLVF